MDKDVKITLRLHKNTRDKLNKQSTQKCINKSSYIRKCIHKHFNHLNKTKYNMKAITLMDNIIPQLENLCNSNMLEEESKVKQLIAFYKECDDTFKNQLSLQLVFKKDTQNKKNICIKLTKQDKKYFDLMYKKSYFKNHDQFVSYLLNKPDNTIKQIYANKYCIFMSIINFLYEKDLVNQDLRKEIDYICQLSQKIK